MQSLQIETGEIRLAINDDPNRVITFNPSDPLFAERFYALMGDFKTTLTEFQSRMRELEKQSTTDENGILLNAGNRIEVVKETAAFMREKIDVLFGAGTSQKAFGDALVLDAFAQFFEGVMPYIQSARKTKIEKYTNKTHNKRK